MALTFHSVQLVSFDMPATLAFYRRLGLDIPASADSESHVEAVTTGGMKLLWDTVDIIKSFDPNADPSRGGTELAFGCDDPAEVDARYAELTEAGYEGHLKPFDAVWGQRFAVVHDPDGNGISLFSALES
ncbi:MAG TPA: VOC family protein [Stackebrandtia sp.]|jgi:catechol 2,3-dioxygenase-like lactoylglutathione lyase family enzyme|uniref:VOC family protein n=1 Tax=Stackebrandtia sp. TaxID=2023065 RepID=UPI002D3F35A2|nr:VOC family protein [Stackebrandtia sp.]HZE39067.1 VOC family protein [Stackebrandtia sp.]